MTVWPFTASPSSMISGAHLSSCVVLICLLFLMLICLLAFLVLSCLLAYIIKPYTMPPEITHPDLPWQASVQEHTHRCIVLYGAPGALLYAV